MQQPLLSDLAQGGRVGLPVTELPSAGGWQQRTPWRAAGTLAATMPVAGGAPVEAERRHLNGDRERVGGCVETGGVADTAVS